MTHELRLPDGFEGDFEALKTFDGWMGESRRLNSAGDLRAGTLGASCPKCYKVIARASRAHLQRGDFVCACPDTEPLADGELPLTLLGRVVPVVVTSRIVI